MSVLQMTGELAYPNSSYVPAISLLTAHRVHLEAAYQTLHIFLFFSVYICLCISYFVVVVDDDELF